MLIIEAHLSVAEASTMALQSREAHCRERATVDSYEYQRSTSESATTGNPGVWRIVLRVIREHALDGIESGLSDLAAVVRASPDHPAAIGARQAIASMLPPGVPLPTTYPRLVARLAADLIDAAAVGAGADVYTPARRKRLRELQRRLLLSLDGKVDYKKGAAIDAFFREVAECAFLPDPDASMELAKLQVTILAEQASRVVPRVEAALARFFQNLGDAAIADIEKAANEFLKGLQELADDAWNAVQNLAAQLAALGREIERAARGLANELERAADVLSSSRRRADILAAVLAYGIEQAERLARAAPGFDLLPGPARQLAIDTAVDTLRTAFDVVSPALNAALSILGDIASDIADLIEDATNLDDAVARLATQIRDRVEHEVNRQLGIFGLALPRELGADDVARVARNTIRNLPLVRDALRACLDAKRAVTNAEERRRDTAFDKARAEQRFQQAVQNRVDEIGGPLAIRILAPARIAPPPQFNWLYCGGVRVRLVIEGARPGFADPGVKRRILLTMNGKPINPPPTSWRFEDNAMRLNAMFPVSALRRGVNLLECAVVDGQGNTARASVAFAWQPGAPAASPEVANTSIFAGGLPFINAVQSESLILVNRSRVAFNLEGWSVADEDRNRFVFPSVTVAPGASVTLMSGRGSASSTIFHWQRASPVWDDRGDTVYLVDPTGVLRHEYTYGAS